MRNADCRKLTTGKMRKTTAERSGFYPSILRCWLFCLRRRFWISIITVMLLIPSNSYRIKFPHWVFRILPVVNFPHSAFTLTGFFFAITRLHHFRQYHVQKEHFSMVVGLGANFFYMCRMPFPTDCCTNNLVFPCEKKLWQCAFLIVEIVIHNILLFSSIEDSHNDEFRGLF